MAGQDRDGLTPIYQRSRLPVTPRRQAIFLDLITGLLTSRHCCVIGYADPGQNPSAVRFGSSRVRGGVRARHGAVPWPLESPAPVTSTRAPQCQASCAAWSHAGSHRGERSPGTSDSHEQRAGARPRSRTDLNRSGCPYGYLRIKGRRNRRPESQAPYHQPGKPDQRREQDHQGKASQDNPADERMCLFARRRDDESRLAKVRGQVKAHGFLPWHREGQLAKEGLRRLAEVIGTGIGERCEGPP